jgi:sterol desaturase/sphingolipid hydroxylase (fatty acid hydroxylase superfamily)
VKVDYFKIISDSFTGYWNYLISELAHPGWHNYFYMLLVLSVAVWVLEIGFPWRKNQGLIRKDFWLDAFYMFFNFFLFSLVAYNAISNVGVAAFEQFLGLFGITNKVAINISTIPLWGQFLIMFIIADIIQWSIHVMLHRVNWMWQFHKVHHSVREMGFAAHLRYHWMETIIYKTILYLPLTMIGFGIDDFFILHAFTVLIGHLNHANVNITYGPLKYIFNNPAMHIWHHAKKMPDSHPYGINFGISLSIWDYLFKTAHIPHSGRDIELGFDDVEQYPEGFVGQVIEPFKKS